MPYVSHVFRFFSQWPWPFLPVFSTAMDGHPMERVDGAGNQITTGTGRMGDEIIIFMVIYGDLW